MRYAKVDGTIVLNYEAGAWVTEGAKVNPTAGTIIADTDELAAGVYDFWVFGATSASFVATDFDLEHRNAANTATLANQRLACHQNIMLALGPFTLQIAEDERLRIETLVNTAYSVQMSIVYVQRIG